MGIVHKVRKELDTTEWLSMRAHTHTHTHIKWCCLHMACNQTPFSSNNKHFKNYYCFFSCEFLKNSVKYFKISILDMKGKNIW